MAEARKTSWVLNVKDKASKTIKDVDKSFTGLNSKFKKFEGTKTINSWSKSLQKTSKNMESLAGKTKGLSLIASGLALKASKDFLDYSSVLSTVKSQAGMTADEIDRLDKSITTMSKRLSSKQIGEQAVVLASAGLDSTSIESTLPTMDKISTLTEDTMSAPEVLLAGKTHLDLNLENVEAVSKFGDQLAKAQSLANFNIADMSQSLIEGGASFKSFNMDAVESLATLATLAELGYKGSRAGTLVNATLSDLISKSEDGAIAIGNQSVSLYDMYGNTKPLPMILKDITRATKDMSDEQRNAVFNQLLGVQSTKLVSNWVEKGTDIYENNAKAIREANGELDKMADDKVDNLTGDLKSLNNEFKDLGIILARDVAPGIRPVVQGLTNIVNGISRLDPNVRKVIGWTVTIVAVITPALLVGAKLVAGISTVIGIVGALASKLALIPTALGVIGLELSAVATGIAGFLGVSTGGLALIVAGVVALGVIIYRNWDNIKTWTSELVESMKTKWNEFTNNLREKFESIKNWWSDLKETLSSPITGVVNLFKRDKSGESNKPGHRTGKDRIPRDGYDFTAHKDEMVLTRRVANAYRKAGGTSTSLPNTGGGSKLIRVPDINVTVNTTGKDAYNDGRQAGRGLRDEIDNYFRDMGFVI